MGFGVLALIITSVLMLVGEKNVSTVFAAFIALSSGAGFVWQIIKLSANETASLVPYKNVTIVRQGVLLLLLITGMFVLVCVLTQHINALKSFAFGMLGAMGLAIQCRRDPLFFKHITSVYLVTSLLVHFIAFIPDWLFWSVWAVSFIGLAIAMRSFSEVSWSASAVTAYHYGLRSGWSPLSEYANLPTVLNFEKRLFPFSLVAGKSVASFIYLIAGLALLLPLMAYFTPWFSVYLYGIMLAPPMLVLSTRWSMLQAAKTLEVVYLLPVFTSKAAIKKKIADQFLILAVVLVAFLWLVAASSMIFIETANSVSILKINAICLALLSGLLSLFAMANYFTNILSYSVTLALAMNAIFWIISLLLFNVEPKLQDFLLLLAWLSLSIVWNYLSIKSWCKEP